MHRKILFIITKSEVGGAQKWVKEQFDILQFNGYQCYLCTNEEGWLTQNSRVENILDKRIEKRISCGLILKVAHFIIKHKIDIIVGNSANGGIYSRIIALLTFKKSIYVTHGWSSVYNGGKIAFIYNFIEYLLSLISSKILCISTNDYKIAIDRIGVSDKKLEIIPNKIFPVACHPIKKNHSYPIKILFLGRLAPPKDPLPLIYAIKDNPKYNLDIIGDGPDFELINTEIEQAKIKNVRLVGEVKDFDSFCDYDIFCLISKSEGLPLSAVEALSCGLPILISKVGGCPEVVSENGYLTTNTSEDIAHGLEIIVNNYYKYSLNSKILFQKKFDLSKKFHDYLRFYERT